MSTQYAFEYDRNAPLEVRTAARGETDGVMQSILIYPSRFGGRRAAALFEPPGGQPVSAAVLFVHWYEPEAPDSNRTQFEYEAIELARRGVASLLVETLWSDRDFFLKRTQEDDFRNSVEQVIELRQALDILLERSGVAPLRLAYVGHDFGGMYGTVLGSVDGRPAYYVIMAATPRFPDWYLYRPRLEGEAREAFLREMEPLDPITHVAALAPAPILFQFATDDFHVPVERAEAFYAAAREPREIRWYEAGHGLNEEAREDRLAWLIERLGV